jgi:hypothetical protein
MLRVGYVSLPFSDIGPVWQKATPNFLFISVAAFSI